MGNLIMFSLDRLSNAISSPHHIVMIGLDGAGKTSLLYKAKWKELVNVHPTMSFNVECLNITKKIKYKIWDIGGRESNRPLWKAYVRRSEAIVFVVDSTESSRFEEARHELFNLLNSESAQLNSRVPILVLANKQDLAGAMSCDLLASELTLSSLNERHLWHIEPTSIQAGDGFLQSLKTLGKMIAQSRGKQSLEDKTPKIHRRTLIKNTKKNHELLNTDHEGILV